MKAWKKEGPCLKLPCGRGPCGRGPLKERKHQDQGGGRCGRVREDTSTETGDIGRPRRVGGLKSDAGWEGGGAIYRNGEVTGRRCFGQGRGTGRERRGVDSVWEHKLVGGYLGSGGQYQGSLPTNLKSP